MIDRTFITAGHAIFTVSNPTGIRYTYRVMHKEANNGYTEAYFVSLLTGPDNTEDYSYLGMLDEPTGEMRLTAGGVDA